MSWSLVDMQGMCMHYCTVWGIQCVHVKGDTAGFCLFSPAVPDAESTVVLLSSASKHRAFQQCDTYHLIGEALSNPQDLLLGHPNSALLCYRQPPFIQFSLGPFGLRWSSSALLLGLLSLAMSYCSPAHQPH